MSVEHDGSPEKISRVTAGIDWASTEHVVAIVDSRGVQQDRFTITHTVTGLRQLVRRLRRAGVSEVAIERPDGPVVDALLDAALSVFVIAPNQIKNLRSRYGSAGNKDDGFDAFVLADTLRTDRPRLRPLTQDSEATITPRMTVRARQDLVAARVAMANQLRAHLQTTLPGAISLFRDIDSAITLKFLTRFPHQDKVDWLSPTRLHNCLRSVRYNHQSNLERLWSHLQDAPRGTSGTEGAARAQITPAWVAALTAIRGQIKTLDQQIAHQLADHPDAAIFTSLPRSGTVRAADSWPRSETPVAGSRHQRHSPAWPAQHPRPASPARSGRRIPLGRRQTAARRRHRLRRRLPPRQPLGGRPLPTRPRPGPRPPHAVRILARAWLHVIWKCWQDQVPYDPDKHHALQRVLDGAA